MTALGPTGRRTKSRAATGDGCRLPKALRCRIGQLHVGERDWAASCFALISQEVGRLRRWGVGGIERRSLLLAADHPTAQGERVAADALRVKPHNRQSLQMKV